ncbi:hypothetical protein C8T65DRAFT_210050 [Cerioporus squamosus]|nr:hypothetical protein C8T65DRAFT_210050 [Cerioporus squamosus]
MRAVSEGSLEKTRVSMKSSRRRPRALVATDPNRTLVLQSYRGPFPVPQNLCSHSHSLRGRPSCRAGFDRVNFFSYLVQYQMGSRYANIDKHRSPEAGPA